jgi:hypothetical protein
MSEGVPARTTAADDAAFWTAVARDQHARSRVDVDAAAAAEAEAAAQADEEYEEVDEPEEMAETALVLATTTPATVMHWTSEERRRREYAAIDRRSRGIRGLLNRLLPRFARSATKSRFYDEERDGSDAGSVRRHRLAL